MSWEEALQQAYDRGFTVAVWDKPAAYVAHCRLCIVEKGDVERLMALVDENSDGTLFPACAE